MVITIAFIESSFAKFNHMYFNNSLRTPKFEIMHTKSLLGQFCFRYDDYKIRISNYYARSEQDYNNTIIHEMIHQYIRQNKIRDTRPHHGRVFNEWADKINRLGGWHIARTDSVEGLGLANNADKKTYNVMAFQSPKGYFLCVLNKKYISDYRLRIQKNSSWYTNHIIFTSTDDKKFANFSACRSSVRGRFITKEEFDNLFNAYGKRVVDCSNYWIKKGVA